MTPMWDLVIETVYLFLPAYAANVAPVIAKRARLWPSLARPLDGGCTFRGQPLFGAHKTIRGFLVGFISAVVVAALQRLGSEQSRILADIGAEPILRYSPIVWGGALGAGALLGDLAKSFVKRRFGIPPGQRWFPWDQVDLIVGAVVAARLLTPLPWNVMITAIVLTPLLSLLSSIAGYLLSVKEAW